MSQYCTCKLDELDDCEKRVKKLEKKIEKLKLENKKLQSEISGKTNKGLMAKASISDRNNNTDNHKPKQTHVKKWKPTKYREVTVPISALTSSNVRNKTKGFLSVKVNDFDTSGMTLEEIREHEIKLVNDKISFIDST